MPNQLSLLVIDEDVLDDRLLDYFSMFGMHIIHRPQLFPNCADPESLAALLVNWSVIQADPTTITKLYRQYAVPIIIISNIYNEAICVNMLEAGADDFMVKPIHPRELHARINVISRRVQRDQNLLNNKKEMLLFNNLRLCPSSRQLFYGAVEILLSNIEYELLLAFVRQPHQIITRDFLSDITQTTVPTLSARRIDLHIYRLRQKIEVDPTNSALIKTIRNKGYILMANVVSNM